MMVRENVAVGAGDRRRSRGRAAWGSAACADRGADRCDRTLPNWSPKKRRKKSSSSWKLVGAIAALPSTRIVTTAGVTILTTSAYDVRPASDGLRCGGRARDVRGLRCGRVCGQSVPGGAGQQRDRRSVARPARA